MFSILPKHFRAVTLCLTLLFSLARTGYSTPAAMSTAAAVQSALEKFHNKDYSAALVSLNPAIVNDPTNAEVLNLKGAILTKQKKFDEAQSCYQEALKNSPKFFPAQYNIGALLALRGEWAKAIDYYRNLLIDNSSNELVEYKLLLLLLHQNADPELQAKLFATDLPTNTPAWYYATASRLYKKGEATEAAKYLVVAKNIYGDQVDIYQEELDESGLNAPKP